MSTEIERICSLNSPSPTESESRFRRSASKAGNWSPSRCGVELDKE
jgi:hypothetical protein